MKMRLLSLLAIVLVPTTVSADRYITNFSFAAGGIATGVWRNITTGTDTGITVSLTHTGTAAFDEGTVLNGAFPWQDFLGNLFEPNYDGDYVALDVPGGGSTQVVIDFGAEVVDPVLHFTDVDVQTTLSFLNATPVAVAGLPNLAVFGTFVTTAGFNSNPLDPTDLETLGSLKFFGTYTELSFAIFNSGDSPTEDDDRTGFSVSTEQFPVVVTPELPQLDIWQAMGHLYLSWPDTTSIAQIEYTTNLMMGTWMPLPGADPTTETEWDAPLSTFGDSIYIRARYTF